MYDDPKIVHPTDGRLTPAQLMLGGVSYKAAAPWMKLPSELLDRTTFWHIATGTPIHPREPDGLRLMGATYASDAPFADRAAGRAVPRNRAAAADRDRRKVPVGGAYVRGRPTSDHARASAQSDPGDAAGQARGSARPANDTLDKLYDLYRKEATPAEQVYIDGLVRSEREVRGIEQDLLAELESITDNSIDSQITAAVSLIRMNIAPVLSINIPFGGDNHHDENLANETEQTLVGVDKVLVGKVRIDPEREIAANKIAALLGRTAPRDLVDFAASVQGE